MIINPTLPLVSPPVVNPIFETFIAENIITAEALMLFLKIVLVTAISLVVGLFLNKEMDKKGFVTNKTVTMILSVVMALGLSLRYGLSVYTFQGLFLFYLLLYASMSDLTNRQVANHVSVSILALSLISVPTVGFVSMLIGGLVVGLIQLFVCIGNDGRHGGADMKITAATAFLLGWSRGMVGLILGLLIGIVFMLIYNKIKNRSNKEGFPLLPFVSIGMMAAFFI